MKEKNKKTPYEFVGGLNSQTNDVNQMNNESKPLSTEELPDVPGITRINVYVSLRTEVFEFFDKLFQLVGISWNEYIQKEIEESIEAIQFGGSDWIGRVLQKKLGEI